MAIRWPQSKNLGRLRLWEIATGRERRRWREAKDEGYKYVRFSSDGRTVAVGVRRKDENGESSQNSIDLWDTIAPTERPRRINGDWLDLRDLAFSPDGKTLATATRDAAVTDGDGFTTPVKSSTRMWDIASGAEQNRFPVDECDVWCLAFSPDGNFLVCGVSDGTIRFYDRATGREQEPRLLSEPSVPPGAPEGVGHGDPSEPTEIVCLAYSPDGSILTGGEQIQRVSFPLASIHIWDVTRRKQLRRIPAHPCWVTSLSFSPDGKTLATSGSDPVIRFWEVTTGRETFQQSGHRSRVRSLSISPADGTIFTGGDDGTLRQWDPNSGRELALVAQLADPVLQMAVAPDGKALAVANISEPIRLWSVTEHREIRQLDSIRQDAFFFYVAFAPDGKTLTSERRVWDTATGRILATFGDGGQQNEEFGIYHPIFYSPDGTQIITADAKGARIWDIAAGREVRRAVKWTNHHEFATLSPDGRFLATRDPDDHSRGQFKDSPVVLWELASGQQAATIEVHEGFNRLSHPFSPDGRLLASASDLREPTRGSTVRVWDLATGREVRRFEGHLGQVIAIAFTPDGRSVVSGSEDATALVWDVSDLKDSLEPGAPLTPQTLQANWNELASTDARPAYRAGSALSVPSAVPFLRDHLRPASSAGPPPDAPISSSEVLRTLRAITSLERINTPKSRAVIELLAKGDPDAITTREAKSTSDRLTRMMRLSTFQERQTKGHSDLEFGIPD